MSSIKNILPTNGLTALALSYVGTSETVSPFVLPWNYKNTRVQSNPFYLQNELDTLSVRISQSAKNYKSNVALRAFTTRPAPLTSKTVNALPTQGVNALGTSTSSSKTLMGLNCNGVQYDALTLAEITDPYFVGNMNPGDLLFEYKVAGAIVQATVASAATQVLSVDLSVTPGYYNLDIANLCNPSTQQTLANIVLNFNGTTYRPVPLNPAAPLTNASEYLITGNRVWFFLVAGNQSVAPAGAQFNVQFNMIERQLPTTIPGLIPSLLIPAQCDC